MNDVTVPSTEISTHKSVHPFLFTILILPMGVSFGYVSITFAYLLSQAGVSVEKIAALIAASYLPHIFKFAWAPLIDTTLSFKKWYKLASIISSIVIIAFGIFPMKESSLPGLTVIVILYQFAITFLCMSTEGMMAYDVKEELKGRAGGFFQAGNLGGVGLGGGLGLILVQRLPAPWMVNLTLGVICLMCTLALFYFKDPAITIRAEKISKTYQNLFKDVWNTLKSKNG
ncbi:MAG: MFS transporter, partial [Chitinophagaceae bacterium]